MASPQPAAERGWAVTLDLTKRGGGAPLPPIMPTASKSAANVSLGPEAKAHKEHLDKRQVAKAMECLMTALAVDRPADPRAYLVEKIEELRRNGLVGWDQLIHPSRRPERPIRPYWLVEDDPWDDYRPTKEMLYASNQYNRRRLLRNGLRGWVAGARTMREEKIEIVRAIVRKTREQKRQVLQTVFSTWAEWARSRVVARRTAFATLQKKVEMRLAEKVLLGWFRFTQDMMAQREWLQRMAARGDDDEFAIAVDDPVTNSLTWDLRLRVFRFLGVRDLCRCAQTCRGWYDVAHDPSLWSMVDYAELAHCTTDTVVQRLVERHRPMITNVGLMGCELVGAPALEALAECRNLQDVNLAGALGVTDAGAREIVRCCRSLLYLNLSCTRITDLALLYLARYASSLECLSVAYCEELTDAGAVSLGSGVGCRALKHLDLSGCRRLSAEGLAHAIEACGHSVITLLLDNLPSLHDAVLFAVAETCFALQRLSLDNCRRATDRGLVALGACTRLRMLTLTNNVGATGAGLKSLLRGAKRVYALNLAGSRCALGADGPAAVSHTAVASLTLSGVEELRDFEVRLLCDTGVKIRSHLTALDLTGCAGVTTVGFESVFRRFPHLTRLVLRGCTGLTDAAFEALYEHPLDELAHLDLSDCPGVGDDALRVIGSHARPTLTELLLCNCSAVTDTGVQALVKGCRLIEELHLAGCGKLTDDAVVAVAFAMGGARDGREIKPATLRVLNLEGCALLTDKAVQCICASNPNLVTLNLFGVPLITAKTADQNFATLRRLQLLVLMDGAEITQSSVLRLRARRPLLEVWFDSFPPGAEFEDGGD